MTETSLEQNLAAARREHSVPGREIHMRDMRGYQFREVCLVTGATADTAVANIWNTTGVCNAIPEQLDALDVEAIAQGNGALYATVGPLRTWMFDRLDVWEAGGDKNFGSITGTWMGAAEASTMKQAAEQGGYYPAYMYRNGTVTFDAGSQVYVLDAPDGEVFVMESFTRHWDAGLSEDKLAHLAERLDFPTGWGFRAELLDQDLEVSSAHHSNLAHVVQDNLHNAYQGSDVARAFSELCQKDSLW